MKDDPRNHLYLQYSKFLKKYNPKMFVFENVLGLRSADGGGYFEKMKAEFKRVGYYVEAFLVNASDFGVLQNRKRIILIGYRKELNINTRFKAYQIKHLVQSIFHDLPKIQAGRGKDKNDKYAKETNEYLNDSYIRNGIDVLTQHVSRPHTDQDKEIYRIAIEHLEEGERLDYTTLPKRLKTHNNQHSFLTGLKW